VTTKTIMNFLKRQFAYSLCAVGMACFFACTPSARIHEEETDWPSITNEVKPWTRWWWHGSALTKEGITAEMEAYQEAGIGGLEITPIYGVYGEEEAFVEYLSPEWVALLMHVFGEAERLGMGIDMATGTGWPFGGPWVSNDDACKNLQHKIYEVKGGSRLAEKIEFIQQPYLRLVGNNLVKAHGDDNRRLATGGKTPVLVDTRSVRITDLIDPVHKNENLQSLAIDQVQFEKPLKLNALVAYSADTDAVDLTDRVDASGKLDWTAPGGDWKIYAVFEGYHGKMVERAGPGGEGNVIDHFSGSALKNYLQKFDSAFKGHDMSALRAFFNDSYEVDDARGSADFTPALFEEFNTRRGYDLRHELPALFGNDSEEKNRRVLCDYRQTLSELLLDNFTMPWKKWANDHGAIVRNQAHGSPANILDLYAVVDIPEIEGTEPLRFKMATSSGNVSGKRLISAEAATWLDEHFQSNLGEVKEALDQFMLHGVNHLVYHGTCYSPPGEPWPGRLFYAAVHMNPRNPMWRDADALNAYVARCQSFLQPAAPDNDVLLYYPVYDRFSAPGREMVEHFDGIGSFDGSSFEKCAELMLEKGFAFDYISDQQIRETIFNNGMLKTSGGPSYRSLVIPRIQYMPLSTLEKIMALANAGAQIIFMEDFPSAPAGYANLADNTKRFAEIIGKLQSIIDDGKAKQKSSVQSGDDLVRQLVAIGVERETMFDAGIQCIRKKNADDRFVYLIKNVTASRYEGWLPLSRQAEAIKLYDPMTGVSGNARIRNPASKTSVFVQLESGQSLILETYPESIRGTAFPYYEIAGPAVPLGGKWKITFDSGGPELPQTVEIDSLAYWTDLDGQSYQDFSGTATYETKFDKPEGGSGRWLLRFESVRESAEVFLNGRSIGTMLGPLYQIEITDPLLQDGNVLAVKVSNLMANRIVSLERNGVSWKKFYNVNFPSRKRENARNGLFYAAHWETMPSGISGDAALYILK
jgi:hypothetical protein